LKKIQRNTKGNRYFQKIKKKRRTKGKRESRQSDRKTRTRGGWGEGALRAAKNKRERTPTLQGKGSEKRDDAATSVPEKKEGFQKVKVKNGEKTNIYQI